MRQGFPNPEGGFRSTYGNNSRTGSGGHQGRNGSNHPTSSTTSQLRVDHSVLTTESGVAIPGDIELTRRKLVKLAIEEGESKWVDPQISKPAPQAVVSEVPVAGVSGFPASSQLPPSNDAVRAGGVSAKKNQQTISQGQITGDLDLKVGSATIKIKKEDVNVKEPLRRVNYRDWVRKPSVHNPNKGDPFMAIDNDLIKAGSSGKQRRSNLGEKFGDCVVDMISNKNPCIKCKDETTEQDSVKCLNCVRRCHRSCLGLIPSPLPGDIFWSLKCDLCENKISFKQSKPNENGFSLYRSVKYWDDVAYLLLSCLNGMNPNQKFFNFDTKIVNFWEKYWSRLHLPTMCNNFSFHVQKKLVKKRLQKSKKFVKLVSLEGEFWGIKENISPAITVGRQETVITDTNLVPVRAESPQEASRKVSNNSEAIFTNAAAKKESDPESNVLTSSTATEKQSESPTVVIKEESEPNPTSVLSVGCGTPIDLESKADMEFAISASEKVKLDLRSCSDITAKAQASSLPSTHTDTAQVSAQVPATESGKAASSSGQLCSTSGVVEGRKRSRKLDSEVYERAGKRGPGRPRKQLVQKPAKRKQIPSQVTTIKDLVQFGRGYRLHVLPKAAKENEETEKKALQFIKEELPPNPPSGWGRSSTRSQTYIKNPANRRRKRDLSDFTSYSIQGRRITETGIQYQVVWRDGANYTSSDDEENNSTEYLYFQDTNFINRFIDEVPVGSYVCVDDNDIRVTDDAGKKGESVPGPSNVEHDTFDEGNWNASNGKPEPKEEMEKGKGESIGQYNQAAAV